MKRPHRFLLAVCLGSVLLCTAACRRDEDPIPREPAGLQIQSALPALPSEETFPPDYVLYDVVYPTTLRFDLNEVAVVEEIPVSFFPAAAEPWEMRASTTSGIFWIDDFAPSAGTRMQRILIDGPRFVKPWLHEFLVQAADEENLGTIDGQVFHRFADGPEVLHALMLFYRADSATGVTSPPEIFDRTPSTAVLANFDLSEGIEQRAMRLVDHLELGEFYTMAAILDTSGDGVYDPELDWWATARNPETAEWSLRFVQALGGLDLQKLEAEMLPPPVR